MAVTNDKENKITIYLMVMKLQYFLSGLVTQKILLYVIQNYLLLY